MKKLYRGLLLVLSIAGFLALNGCTAVQEQVNPTQINSQWLNQSFERYSFGTGVQISKPRIRPFASKRWPESPYSSTSRQECQG